MVKHATAGKIAATLVIIGLFYYFAKPGLSYYLDDDDIMNLRQSWPAPVSKFLSQIVTFEPQAYRPVGLLFYRAMFTISDLHTSAYHAVCFALLLLNLYLLFVFARALTGSIDTAVLTALLAS